MKSITYWNKGASSCSWCQELNLIPVTAIECSKPKEAVFIASPFKLSTFLGTETTLSASEDNHSKETTS